MNYWRDSLKTLFPYIIRHKVLLGGAIVSLLVASAANLAFPALARHLLEPQSSFYLGSAPVRAGAACVGLFLLQSILFYIRTWTFGVLAHRVVFSVRTELFHRVILSEVPFLEQQGVRGVVDRIIQDTALLQDALAIRFSVLLRYLLQVVIGVLLMAALSIRLTLLLCATIPIFVGISMLLGKKLRRQTKEQQHALSEANKSASESVAGIKTIRVLGAEEIRERAFTDWCTRVLSFGVSRTHTSAVFQSSMTFILNTILVILFLYSLSLVSKGLLSSGDLVGFILYGATVAVSFSFIAGSLGELAQSLGGWDRISEYLTGSSISVSTSTPSFGPLPISVHSLSFSYPSRPEQIVLKEVSLEIPQGTTVALIGESGCGKSSLLQVLLGFYPPLQGEILFGEKGTSLSRTSFGYVPQDPTLFSVSVRENLLYAKPTASEEELWKVLDQVNLKEFILSLSEKLETTATGLSGGQKQRLALAQLFLRTPSIILLDEATSALDLDNERRIYQALLERFPTTTTIIISHRVQSLPTVNKIVVMKEGRIIEQGKEKDLLEKGGVFAKLKKNPESVL